MKQLSFENVWQMDEKELLKVLNTESFIPRPKKIRFYAPSFMYYKTSHFCSSPSDFPTISVTGKSCALKCKHCGGIVLDTMHPVITSEKLIELCKALKKKGASGCLISGGCLPDGSVPLAKFVDAITKIKRDLDLTVFAHTGIINANVACALKKAGVDAALIDIIGSDETIREIYKMNVTVKDYANSLKALNDSGVPFVPHVIVGLHYGRLEGEWNALKMISKHKPSALVIIAFMPIRETEMQNTEPPKPLDIARVTATARLMFPSTPLVLGCMRPKGKTQAETDILAVKAGVDAIAFPAEEVVKYAETHEYKVAYSSFCCAQIYADYKVRAAN
jgi:uncharacterized radical SAM superfamily protein